MWHAPYIQSQICLYKSKSESESEPEPEPEPEPESETEYLKVLPGVREPQEWHPLFHPIRPRRTRCD